MRVAALPDVHGNAPALAAVLADVAEHQVDAIVFCGDLTWGPLPNETLELVRSIELPTDFVRGNADRTLGGDESARGVWLAAQHGPEATAFVNGFPSHVVLDVDGLGPTRFVHGSPRSDEECVTPRTPEERVREFMAGVPERVVVTAHVHVSYDRQVGDVRLIGPGSVGRPYEGKRGARWAILGPGVDLRGDAVRPRGNRGSVSRKRHSERGGVRRRRAARPDHPRRDHRRRRSARLRQLTRVRCGPVRDVKRTSQRLAPDWSRCGASSGDAAGLTTTRFARLARPGEF
jgi:putative phosphoesterase